MLSYWFVDLTLHPTLPIQYRAVKSSVGSVARIGCQRGNEHIFRCVPDDTPTRKWVKAHTAGEALCLAQDGALEERAA